VLVAEDEALLSMMMEDVLVDLGCIAVGPAARVEDALSLVAQAGRIDIGLLDLNLGGESSLPVADRLAARGVPFAFASGYDADVLAGTPHANTPVLAKPFTTAALTAMLETLAEAAPHPHVSLPSVRMRP
jgi:CheY-like chemotaxis protein